MKICILSMQRVLNFGSLLQSYALKKILEELGHSVSFLDIERREEDDRLLSGNTHIFLDEGYSKGFFAKLKKVDRYFFNRIRIKVRSNQQNKRMQVFRKEMLHLDERSNREHYDCCVIGSDEVFNCMSGARWGFTGQLFGDVKQTDKVITYAASCGATVLEEIPEAAKERIAEAFRQISAFSVRDTNTRNLVAALSDKTVLEHLDPVLIGDFEEELQATKLPEKLPDRYCVVYSYYNRIHKEEEIAEIRKFCKNHDLEIVTVGAPQMWVKNHLILDPFEVLRVFADADFVITDTFHGTIFSAKYAKRFATITRESNQNKLGDLIHRLGVQGHLIESFDQLEEVYHIESSKNAIELICREEFKKSLQYFRKHCKRELISETAAGRESK